MKFSSKVEKCGLSPMRKFHPYAVAAKARGVNIYHLNIGQPDVQTPPAFFEAVRHFEQPVLAYAPSPGIPELIDAIQNGGDLRFLQLFRFLEVVPRKLQIVFRALTAVRFCFAEQTVVTGMKLAFPVVSKLGRRHERHLCPPEKVVLADLPCTDIVTARLEDRHADAVKIVQTPSR